jgi:hypothetical protein
MFCATIFGMGKYEYGDRFRFIKVKDSRGREVEGLWVRNGRFYAQVYRPDKGGPRRQVLLNEQGAACSTVPQAISAKAELALKMRQGELPGPRIAPLLKDWVAHYLKWIDDTEAKSALTVMRERCSLGSWVAQGEGTGTGNGTPAAQNRLEPLAEGASRESAGENPEPKPAQSTQDH